MLVGVVSVVGLPSAVAAAPSLAMALGNDVDDALENDGDLTHQARAWTGQGRTAPRGPA